MDAAGGQLLRTGKESWLRTYVGVAVTTAVAHLATGNPRAAVAALDGGRALLLDGAPPAAARLDAAAGAGGSVPRGVGRVRRRGARP